MMTEEQKGTERIQSAGSGKTGTVLDIQRMSTEDGPGIRTTVFMKGCSLKCGWCHNPESISPRPQVHWLDTRCIGCHTCADVCKQEALSVSDQGVAIDRGRCIGCGDCVEECPSTALEMLGAEWAVDDLAAEVMKDRAYYDKSGGGVTLSGGEPVLQSSFVTALLKRLRGEGVHIALDTCGRYAFDRVEPLLPYTVLVLYDLKTVDAARHQALTGYSNKKILDNLVRIAGSVRSQVYPRELWIRTPIIPGATDDKETIASIGRFMAEKLAKTVTRWELCAFNNLCRDKYDRLGLAWPYADSNLMESRDMEALAETARQSGVDPAIVQWSGATRIHKQGTDNHRSVVTRKC
jgi:pyruvate formate lyase activating enzyme